MDFGTTQITLAKELVSRENQDGSVIIMKVDDSDCFYKIDGVAAVVWSFLNNNKTLSEAVDHILGEYEVKADQLQTDIEKFLEELSQKMLIQIQ